MAMGTCLFLHLSFSLDPGFAALYLLASIKIIRYLLLLIIFIHVISVIC